MKSVFHRDILRDQFQDFMEQLVTNGDMNTPTPVTGRSDNWARFHWGSPERINEDWQSPVVYVRDFGVAEQFEAIDKDRLQANMIIGVAIGCEASRGLQRSFDNLWHKIQRLWGRNAANMPLTGTYTLNDISGNPTSYTNIRIGQLGIVKAELLGSITGVDNGRIYQHFGQLVIELIFNHSLAVSHIGGQ